MIPIKSTARHIADDRVDANIHFNEINKSSKSLCRINIDADKGETNRKPPNTDDVPEIDITENINNSGNCFAAAIKRIPILLDKTCDSFKYGKNSTVYNENHHMTSPSRRIKYPTYNIFKRRHGLADDADESDGSSEKGDINFKEVPILDVQVDETSTDLDLSDSEICSLLSWQEKPIEFSIKNFDETEEMPHYVDIRSDECNIAMVSRDILPHGEPKFELTRYFNTREQSETNKRGNSVELNEFNETEIKEMDVTETSLLFAENERFPECACSCHCRRNYQQYGYVTSRGFKRKHRSQSLPQKLESSSPGVIKTTDSNLTKSACRTRLKSVNLSEISAANFTKEIRLRCKNVCVRLKENMAKVLFYCVIFLLLCFCGGVLMMHRHSEETEVNSDRNEIYVPFKDFKQDKYAPVTDSSILLDLPFKAISTVEFEKHLSKSRSAAEMLKIFFDDQSLTEDQVNSIMYMKSHQVVYGSKNIRENPMISDQADERSYRELAYQQYLEFERNPISDCHEPVPEIEQIVDTHSDSVRHYLPSCTIVHRCRNTTGCCPRGLVCAPKRENGIELIEKFFLVLEAVPGTDSLRPAKDLVAAKTFINHTACECQQIDVVTNCNMECPNQFSKHRPGVDCECICHSGHRKCQRIHKGLLPLDEKDLECIKEERCIIPTCEVGEFNINTGFCPHFRRERRDRGRH